MLKDPEQDDADTAGGGAGNDTIDVKDGDGRDIVTCGLGKDKVTADPGDNVDPRCSKG